MIGLALLLASLLLMRAEGKGLSELGFNAPLPRARQFAAGLAVAGLAASAQQVGYAYVSGTEWIQNPSLSGSLVLDRLRWNANSVIYEELLFRGYLLYQAIRILGERRAILLDACVFGIYHWFSYGVIGNPVAMAYVLLNTGLFGLMFAMAFSRTGSLALPIGLHLGWNLATNFIFSAGPLGAGLLIAANGAERLKPHGGPAALLKFILPALVVAGVCWYLRQFRTPISRRKDSNE